MDCVRQRCDACAEADVTCALGGYADDYFGRENFLEADGMTFTDPSLVVAEGSRCCTGSE